VTRLFNTYNASADPGGGRVFSTYARPDVLETAHLAAVSCVREITIASSFYDSDTHKGDYIIPSWAIVDVPLPYGSRLRAFSFTGFLAYRSVNVLLGSEFAYAWLINHLGNTEIIAGDWGNCNQHQLNIIDDGVCNYSADVDSVMISGNNLWAVGEGPRIGGSAYIRVMTPYDIALNVDAPSGDTLVLKVAIKAEALCE